MSDPDEPQLDQGEGDGDDDGEETILHHIILPPRCPNKASKEPDNMHSKLLNFIVDGAESFNEYCPEHEENRWEKIFNMLLTWKKLQQSGPIDRERFDHALKTLGVEGEITS
jgi:hypothetical protein